MAGASRASAARSASGTLREAVLSPAPVEGLVDGCGRVLPLALRQQQEHDEVLRQSRPARAACRRPVPSCGPSARKNGTSAPTRAASSASAAGSSCCSSCAFASRSAVAASELPPPSPAATGIRFSIRTRQPCGAASASSARRTIVSSANPSTVVSAAGSTVIRSPRSTRWKTVTSSCLPSSRSGPTTSARLIFAGAAPIT